MCFCDGNDYLVTKKSTGDQYIIAGDETLTMFFKGLYSLPFLLHRYVKKEQVRFEGKLYTISRNFHPECEQVRRDVIKKHKDSEFKGKWAELWGRCPDKYRYLLPSERQ